MSKPLFVRAVPSKVINLVKTHRILTLIVTAAILVSIAVIGVTAANTNEMQQAAAATAKPKSTGEVKSASDTAQDENAGTTPTNTTEPKPSTTNTNTSPAAPKTTNNLATTTNKPAGTAPPSTKPSPAPSPNPDPTPSPSPAPNPNATFYVDLAPGSYKDKATNTLVQPYTITREPGHTAALTKSVTNGGVSCSLGSDNAIRMTFEPVMPANFYWCRLFVSDGKTTRSVDFAIHHSGGPTN